MLTFINNCPVCGKTLVSMHVHDAPHDIYWEACICGYKTVDQIATTTTTSSTYATIKIPQK